MKYAIFDLDGTLVDSMTMWRSVGKTFLEQHGYPPLKYAKKSSNDTWEKDFLNAVREELGIDVTYDYFFKWFSDYVIEQYSHHLPLKPYAKELLERLKADGVKMCICSSTHRFMMQPALERLDLLKYFDFTCHCNEFGKEKNQPDIFFHCMEKLGAENPCEVAVFEDAFYSANTAKNAGFYVVGIYDVTEHRNEQMKAVCNQYISDFSQIDYENLPK